MLGAALAAAALAAKHNGLMEGPQTLKIGANCTNTILFCVSSIPTFVESTVRIQMLKLKLFESRNFSGVNITTFSMFVIAGFYRRSIHFTYNHTRLFEH